jgi:hypothetical protein
MNPGISKTQLALAVATALGAAALTATPRAVNAGEHIGTYVAGDFHNHTTCVDGSTSIQKVVDKSTTTPWGLDWFVQAGHGGNGNRNCTLAEDASLATPAYPLEYAVDGVTLLGPNTTWQNNNPAVTPKGDVSGSSPNQNMWKWQSTQEYIYPLMEYLAAYKNLPLFVGVETVTPGHEHTSMSVITGQMPSSLDSATLPTTPGYSPLGNATALSKWEYCFDRGDTDHSRGNATVGTVPVPGGNNWDCSVPGSANALDSSWNATAQKLIPAGGTGTGNRGHAKSLEGLKWMNAFQPQASYYVPAHLERAGPFNPDGNNGFNVESLRDFNNTAPNVAFGFESQPGHGASDNRGEYRPNRNVIGGVKVDSVGGTTWGGTGVYAAQVGGVWDALLGEGRNWWFFASSDWHNRGIFGSEDRRSTQDFYPGEYQRNFTMVHRDGDAKYRPQMIVDGLRTGNNWAASGQLVDRLAFIACAVPPEVAKRTGPLAEAIGNALVETLAVLAAWNDTDAGNSGCVTMGQKLTVRPGSDIIVGLVVRDPSGASFSPYTFDNPSLLAAGIHQPLNRPVLDHIDVIDGKVTGFKDPADTASYAGEWPRTWLANPDMATVPAAAKNTSAAVMKTFTSRGWNAVPGARDFKAMTFRLRAVKDSQYVRLRGTNLPPAVPFETDASGNPLADVYTNANLTAAPDGVTTKLSIPCTTVGTNVPKTGDVYTGAQIDGCPDHLPKDANGQKMVAYDVAAWSDIWFYSNPIFVEVQGSTPVAGVK